MASELGDFRCAFRSGHRPSWGQLCVCVRRCRGISQDKRRLGVLNQRGVALRRVQLLAERGLSSELAKKLVRVNSDAVLLVQLLKDSALVEALVDHLHHCRVLLLANLASSELVQHVGDRIKDTLEAENAVFILSVDW